MFEQTRLKLFIFTAMMIGLLLYSLFGGYFAREIVIEIAILAILALSLDFLAGYGAMVSLAHGAIMGLGAYVYASLNTLMGLPPLPAMVIAIICSCLFGGLLGFVTSRIEGIFFIMATLAFGQMVYTAIFHSPTLGGDDGIWGIERLDISWFGVDLSNSLHMALGALFFVALCYFSFSHILKSGFGRSFTGIGMNEPRMKALGAPIAFVKMTAFAISASWAGFAGVIMAQHTLFISPDIMVWTISGEILVVIILGGLGTLIGAIIGAVCLVFAKHSLSNMTDYWHMIIGFILIASVMAGGKGLYGVIHFIALKFKQGNAQHDR